MAISSKKSHKAANRQKKRLPLFEKCLKKATKRQTEKKRLPLLKKFTKKATKRLQYDERLAESQLVVAFAPFSLKLIIVCCARSAPRKNGLFGGKYLFKVPLKTLLEWTKRTPFALKSTALCRARRAPRKNWAFLGKYISKVPLRTLLE